MSVNNYIDTDRAFRCPACGEEECSLILLYDEEYADRNNLPRYCSVEISENGEFEIVACGECGYKWVMNEGIATTSQLKALILSHMIQKVRDCSEQTLEFLIGELDDANGIPRNEQESLLIYEYGNTLESCKLAYLAVLDDYIERCDVCALVDMYNDAFIHPKVNDAAETEGELDDAIANNTPLKAKEVHIDD